MKKKQLLILKKINYYLIFCLSTLLLFINSCKKDRDKDFILTDAELISEAKIFFNEEVKNLPQLDDDNPRHSLVKIPVWEKATTKKISLGNAVVVPIKYATELLLKPENGERAITLSKTSYLMIYRDRKKNLVAEWVNLMPIKNLGSRKFEGVVNIEEWNGKAKRAFAVNEMGKSIPVYMDGNKTFNQVNYNMQVTCVTYTYWGRNFYTGGQSDFYVIRTETYCTGSSGSGEGQEGQGSGSSPNQNDEEEISDYVDYYVDCDGVVSGSAYESDCGCIGGTTGITACLPDDPCAKRAGLQTQLSNTTISNLKTSILAKTDGKEWGAKQILNSLSMTSGYKPTPLETNNSVDSINVDFCWNSTEGYAIGTIHNHPSGNAPSYQDVFKMVTNLSDPEIAASGTSGINFYKSNISTTVVTSTGTYVVTVKSWTELTKNFGEWVANPAVYDAEYRNAITEYTKDNPSATTSEKSSFALLAMLNKGINIYKSDPNSNVLKPLNAFISSANILTLSQITCP